MVERPTSRSQAERSNQLSYGLATGGIRTHVSLLIGDNQLPSGSL